jgi:hypothetical protein
MNDPVAKDLERALEAARRRVDPLAEDRARISERLRAALGAEIVDGPVRLPASGPARIVPGRNGWLAAVLGTGIVTGAIGFVLGYGLGLGDRSGEITSPLGAPVEAGTRASAEAGTFASGAASSSSSSASSLTPASVGAPPDAAASTAPREPAPPAKRTEPAARNESASAAVKRPAARVLGTPANEGTAAPIRQPVLASHLAFAEVVERLRRANIALGDAKPALAIIELRDLDRLAGDTLQEERDMTHLLAACALGDVDEAARRARRLLASQTSSIYAPRIERSCAREGGR